MAKPFPDSVIKAASICLGACLELLANVQDSLVFQTSDLWFLTSAFPVGCWQECTTE
jgi:hypothetical protein